MEISSKLHDVAPLDDNFTYSSVEVYDVLEAHVLLGHFKSLIRHVNLIRGAFVFVSLYYAP